MRATRSRIAGAALVSLVLAPSIAGADVVNGSFETGDFTGWTLAKDAASPDFATIGLVRKDQIVGWGAPVYDYVDRVAISNFSTGLPLTGAPTTGSWHAVLLQNGPSTVRLTQVVTVADHTAMSWDLGYHAWSGAFSPTQRLRIAVRDTDTGEILAIPFQTDDAAATQVPMTHDEADLPALGGRTVAVEIELAAREGFFDVWIDSIHLDAPGRTEPGLPHVPNVMTTVGPETEAESAAGCTVATGGGLAPLCAALAAVVRRRRVSRCRG